MADEEGEWHVPRLCVVMFRFQGIQGAHDAVRDAKADGWHREGIEADAIVSHEASGKVHMHDPGAEVMGAAFGVTTATILGLIGGPWVLLAMVVAGGVLGGLAGHFAGRIIPAEDLHRVAEALPPDSSAYLVLVEDHDVERVKGLFADRADRVLSLPVSTELAGVMGPGLTRQMQSG